MRSGDDLVGFVTERGLSFMVLGRTSKARGVVMRVIRHEAGSMVQQWVIDAGYIELSGKGLALSWPCCWSITYNHGHPRKPMPQRGKHNTLDAYLGQ